MVSNKLSDSLLVSHYQKGNEEAFEILVNRHKSRVYTSIYFLVKDRILAEDLMQDVFMKVVQTIKDGKYNEEGKFLPWVLRISHNLSVDYFRKKKRSPEIVMEDGSPVLNSLQFSDYNEEGNRFPKESKRYLRSLIKELPVEQKQVLIMRHFLGMSFQEIADRSGVSINTALGRMRYALINLKKKINNKSIAYDQDFYPK